MEGVAFAFSRPSAVAVVAAEVAAFALLAGPRVPARIAASTLLVGGTLKALQMLALSFRHAPTVEPALASVWDW